MKWIAISIAAAGILGLGFNSKIKSDNTFSTTQQIAGTYAPVAVLELFTSEGCSSCPSADRLLPELAKLDKQVVPLSFHVDYWNRLGWKDPFSSAAYSERQRQYAMQFRLDGVYTPQLVVNGEYELVGSNKSKAVSAINKVLQQQSEVTIAITNIKMEKDKLFFTVTTEGDLKQTNILAALVQKQAVINVKSGENGGSKLSHTNVVREFEVAKAETVKEFKLSFPSDLATANWQLVVYAQQKNDLKITGASVYSSIQ